MASIELFLENAKNYIKSIPKGKLYIYLFLFIALFGGSILGLSIMQKDNYQVLFSGLSTEDASMIVAKLKEHKVPYKLGTGGTSIYVPKENVYEVRLLLASQNALPGNSGVGFELFDKTNYGMTEFLQNVNYKRAIQGELSRTINQMPEVKGSRVHIAIPEKTLFSQKETEKTASVFLKLKPGKVLSKDQIMGIVQLVAGSVEGMRPENVAVIDSSGKVLYKGGDSNSPVTLSGHQFELQRNVEKKIEESIQTMLDRFLPANKSIVKASVELNLRRVEKVEEEYYPEKVAVNIQKKLKEKTLGKTSRASGVPGVASNNPGSIARENIQGNNGRTNESEKEREEAQTTFEVSKTVRKIVEPFGDIKRISVAVVIDGKYEKIKGQKGEEVKYIPRPQKELNDIKSLIARAIGFDEGRGDKIEVVNMPFEVESFADEKEMIERAERKELIYNVGKYVFYLSIVLSFLFFVIRPIISILKHKNGISEVAEAAKDIYIKSGEQLKEVSKANYEAIQANLTPQPALVSALKDKSVVTSVIKGWIRER
ncbi:MAG: flagellar basal-body MS-ring/collar protein FliF [Syntrophorhabdaceae bacterium]|nr:flagellar basal-body MS-ring/collar protein FliF [Syntrophorhabdaceae bacterium]